MSGPVLYYDEQTQAGEVSSVVGFDLMLVSAKQPRHTEEYMLIKRRN